MISKKYVNIVNCHVVVGFTAVGWSIIDQYSGVFDDEIMAFDKLLDDDITIGNDSQINLVNGSQRVYMN